MLRGFITSLLGIAFLQACDQTEQPLPGTVRAAVPTGIEPYESRRCDVHRNLYDALEGRDGIFISEIHGQTESAHLAGCIARHYALRGFQVAVSLELPNRDKALAKSWQNGLKSTTVGTAEMRCAIDHIKRLPNVSINYHANGVHIKEDGGIDTARQEREMGESIVAAKAAADFVIAVGGNLHASRAVFSEFGEQVGRAGFYLPDTFDITVVANVDLGEARYCSDFGCDVFPVSAKGGEPFTVREASNPNVDLVYSVPTLSASSDSWDDSRCKLTTIYAPIDK